ncbi:MAG: glycosyltransferase family 39 protein [Chloroflexota bacterium]
MDELVLAYERARLAARPRQWLPCLAIVAVAFVLALARGPHTGFNPDESRWISRAHYLSALGDPFGPVWQDSYRTRGQPPVGSYVTGLGLVLQGRDLDTNSPWNFTWHGDAGWQKNIARGNMPDPDDLAAARRFSAMLIALSAGCVWAIGRHVTTAAGAAVGGLAYAVHPFPAYLGSIATSDASFTLLVALAALCAARLAARPTLLRGLALGIALGLGAGNKLSPLLASVPLGALGCWLLLTDLRQRQAVPRDRLGWLLAATPLVTIAVFLGCYPYFWPDPVDRVRNLFAFRVREMRAQATDWPVMAVPTRWEALRRVALNFSERYSLLGGAAQALEPLLGRRIAPPPLELFAALAGVAAWGAEAARRGPRSPAALAFVALGGQVAVTILGMRSEFDRYHAPMAVMGAVAFGALAGAVLPRLAARLPRRAAAGHHPASP